MKHIERALLAVGMTGLLVVPAYAYLDPSVMTYAIQIIAGIVVAVGAVVGILWRKAKKKVSDKLGIDENAKKEIEDDIVVTDTDDSSIEAQKEETK
mgnify:FL=1